ncbi:MAG: response regulator [Patescibacteria group bacterium]
MFGKKTAKKVLIVEDDALLASVLLERFSEEKLDTLNVNNGLKVMQGVKGYKPDIILLDLILPGIDGFEVLKQLKDDNSTKNIPVFVLSNLNEQADVRSVKALGAEEYFIKANTQMSKIVEAVKKRIGK